MRIPHEKIASWHSVGAEEPLIAWVQQNNTVKHDSSLAVVSEYLETGGLRAAARCTDRTLGDRRMNSVPTAQWAVGGRPTTAIARGQG